MCHPLTCGNVYCTISIVASMKAGGYGYLYIVKSIRWCTVTSIVNKCIDIGPFNNLPQTNIFLCFIVSVKMAKLN